MSLILKEKINLFFCERPFLGQSGWSGCKVVGVRIYTTATEPGWAVLGAIPAFAVRRNLEEESGVVVHLCDGCKDDVGQNGFAKS